MDGFIRWYREMGKSSAFSEQIAAFERSGVTLNHADANSASLVNVDGDDVSIEIDALRQVLELRVPSVSVNWWLTSGTNVVGEYAHEPLGCEIQTFWMDGVSLPEAKTFASAVTAAASAVATPTRALICDYQGITDADDWNSVALYGQDRIPGLVDSLLLDGEIACRVLEKAPMLRGQAAGPSIIRLTSA
ncbi:hypothetical protein OKJ48_22620 [Streptomyces kunmingensis]|uniref:Uncharacterized protein n=1 Tax=Streptomyces kunmingensis TaxID=68225 RepID=A0ABU6CEX3_9ACTN|nr:hypothetical protein [Streptomyces kunmingensis]MEB3963019.1 hypothetical protein [Streptomyces kunmingensis]